MSRTPCVCEDVPPCDLPTLEAGRIFNRGLAKITSLMRLATGGARALTFASTPGDIEQAEADLTLFIAHARYLLRKLAKSQGGENAGS